MKKWIKDIFMITIGTLIYAASVSLFLDPNHLAPGGATGIAIILTYFAGLKTGTWYFIINVPIVILGLWKFGVKFMARTFYAILLSSFFTNLLSNFDPVTDDLVLASITGAMLMAAGIAIIFKSGATTGGTDIIVKLVRQKYRHLKTGFIFMCFDIVVVALSGIVFKDVNIALYALMVVVIDGKMMDYVLYGPDEAKLVYIITEKPEMIGKKILEDMDVGYTYIQGKGGYTERDKQVIMVAVHKKASPQLEEIVKAEDPEAFMILTNATEIYGEGYKDIFAETI